MSLDKLREQIDQLDGQLVKLLNFAVATEGDRTGVGSGFDGENGTHKGSVTGFFTPPDASKTTGGIE